MRPRADLALARRPFAALVFALLACLAFTPPAAAAHQGAVASSLVLPGVEIRPGVTLDVHVGVWGDTGRDDCQFLVTGFQHASPSWAPYVAALPGRDACALALDLPGRQATTVPAGVLFSDLTLDDYVTVILETLTELRDHHGVRPGVVVGHSMGGLLVQRAQHRLLSAGSSLSAFGISEAVLLASTPPAGLPYALADSGAADAILGAFVGVDPQLGTVVVFPTALWPTLFFSNFAGEIAPGTPSAAIVDAEGYAGFAEPFVAGAQLVGGAGFDRIAVAAGTFADGDVRLRQVVYGQDTLVLASEGDELYLHLTGDPTLACLTTVHGDYAVHDLHLVRPERVVAAVQTLAACGQ